MSLNIDFNTCTMADVIARSLLLHPSLFAETLERVARTHREASYSLRFDSKAADIAARMARECEFMADDISTGRGLNSLEFGETIQAFGVACKLQCISPGLGQEIAARADKAKAEAEAATSD
jgi:hypothetical protein